MYFVNNERLNHEVYPPADQAFAAFEATPLQKVKVVLLGQDPYHREHQAMGLSFSVSVGTPIPPSLRNIFKELHNDLDVPVPPHGDLTSWAEQGVLLLNTTLSVHAGKPGSHIGIGWEFFTDHVIEVINAKRTRVVFLLWGSHARQKKVLITNPVHVVFEAPHPSPFSAHRGFFGAKPFSRTNESLTSTGQEPIHWQI